MPVSVVVIEAHPLMREALLAALTIEPGWQVIALSDSQAAIISAVQAAPPSLILLSLGNPGAADLRLLAMLRQALPAVPILALITNEVPEQAEAAVIAGASHVSAKSAPREELMNAVHIVLNSVPLTATDLD